MSSRRMAGDTSAPECPSRVTYDEAGACLAGSGDAARVNKTDMYSAGEDTWTSRRGRPRLAVNADGTPNVVTMAVDASLWRHSARTFLISPCPRLVSTRLARVGREVVPIRPCVDHPSVRPGTDWGRRAFRVNAAPRSIPARADFRWTARPANTGESSHLYGVPGNPPSHVASIRPSVHFLEPQTGRGHRPAKSPELSKTLEICRTYNCVPNRRRMTMLQF